ncbi:hypothetical protein RHO13_02865 [Orbus wheelerorum]|uniref:hypothetical protein n=1 Tax=Orbus wheelerorum TaxID=3074111 RepID=UPI00370D093E
MKKLASIALIALLGVTSTAFANTDHNQQNSAKDSNISTTMKNDNTHGDRHKQDKSDNKKSYKHDKSDNKQDKKSHKHGKSDNSKVNKQGKQNHKHEKSENKQDQKKDKSSKERNVEHKQDRNHKEDIK